MTKMPLTRSTELAPRNSPLLAERPDIPRRHQRAAHRVPHAHKQRPRARGLERPPEEARRARDPREGKKKHVLLHDAHRHDHRVVKGLLGLRGGSDIDLTGAEGGQIRRDCSLRQGRGSAVEELLGGAGLKDLLCCGLELEDAGLDNRGGDGGVAELVPDVCYGVAGVVRPTLARHRGRKPG